MQLCKGEIELNGIYFRPDTNINEVYNNPRFHSYVEHSGPLKSFGSKNVDVEGYTFFARILFDEGRLYTIELTPVNLEMEDPGYPDEKYQKEKKNYRCFFAK